MVAFLVLAASLIATFLILFLHPILGNEQRVLTVRFNNIDKILVGSRVTFAGKPVGEVYSITDLTEVVKEKISHDGIIYPYELVLKVDSSVNVFNIDDIAIVTSGLLGEKSINITPIAPQKGQKFHLVNDEIIYGRASKSLEEAIGEVSDVTVVFKDAMQGIVDVADAIKKEKLVIKAGETLDHFSSIGKALDDPDALQAILDNLNTLFDKIVKSWDVIDTSLKNLVTITANGDKITTQIAKGEGTAGRLIMRDDLYLKVNSILSKGDILFNDINHYGILFHTDKGWQRLRARRLNLMQRLSTPEEFHNYFNDEVDEIYTSLNRVSMILHVNEEDMCCQELLDNRQFTQVFVDLLKRIDTLNEEVKSYNIQLFDECK